MQQSVVGQEVGVEGAGGAHEAQLLALQLRLDVGNHVFNIITKTSDNIGATSSAVDVLRVTVGAVVDGLAGAEELAEARDRCGVFIEVRDVLTSVQVQAELPALVQGGHPRHLVQEVVFTEGTHHPLTGAAHRGVTRVASTGTTGSGEQEGEEDTSSEAPHDEKLTWS